MMDQRLMIFSKHSLCLPQNKNMLFLARRVFNDNFTPTDTHVPLARGALLSPNTLNVMVENNKEVHRVACWSYHFPGEPILLKALNDLLSTELRLLHDTILCREKYTFSHGGGFYPIFPVMVQLNLGLGDDLPPDKFYVPFEDIFNLFHLYKLGPSLIRLWAINTAYTAICELNKVVAVADSYLMQESNENLLDDRQAMRNYLTDFMLANTVKDCLLVPYYPK